MNSGLHANFVESLVIKIRVEEFQCHIKDVVFAFDGKVAEVVSV